ncbi:MAG: cobalamin biosynthesis protein CbiD [Clostridia bacterium]|nr:cobalamin biosynthesis protein CbiD [Clostridia bacterium]
MRFEHYISVGRERLRCGYTTGTCAAAAARGAAELLLGGERLAAVRIETPAGISVDAELLNLDSGPGWAACAVRKDGGDDPDATHTALICARVERLEYGVEVDGGVGVGRVTRPGLDQCIGAAAINSVPRRMIEAELRGAMESHGAKGGLKAVISVPEGQRIAAKTFNPRLGIVGGISILGTSGIVRPMSEAALIASVHLELDMLAANGARDVVITPGNYGEDFSRDVLGLGLAHWATCSNYIGEAIDHAAGLGFRSLLLVGHIGKLVKVAAGNLNTHSRVSDARRETLAAHTALAGGKQGTVRAVFDAPTTDAAIEILNRAGLCAPVMDAVARELELQLKRRAGESMRMEALFFSNRFGILGKTSGADELLACHTFGKDV